MSQENILSELLDADSNESDLASDISDVNYDPENYESSSNSESEVEEVDANELYVSKDKMVWSAKPCAQPIGSVAQNIIKSHPGVTRFATSRCSDIKSAFLLFFPRAIVTVILANTNKFGQNLFGNEWKIMDETILHAYIAVLILAGACRGNNEDVHGLYDATFGRPIFRAIMSEKQFKMICRALRFDDVMNRRNQRSMDKFLPIRELWDRWQQLLPMYYNCHENITIDEQLVAFRGRCPFRQFMPSKPAKYGLKFWLAVDSKSGYIWKIQPYLGKTCEKPEKNQGERVVLDLVEGLEGQNITTDNFFTSYQLAQKLLERKLSLVGTVRKNKTFIPPKLLLFKKIPLYTSTFAFRPSTTLVSYICHKNKATILLSTMHSKAEINDGPKRKPEIVSYYNTTKGSVDTADQMLSCYSTKRKTNRWPTVVFANIIDISALNAYIIYSEIDPSWAVGDETRKRASFLQTLALDLAKKYMQERTCAPKHDFAKDILREIQRTSTTEEQPSSSRSSATTKSLQESRKRGYCKCCKSKVDIQCSSCGAYVCKKIRKTYCQSCK